MTDAWDANARKLMLRHTFEAKSGINFAPDTTYEMQKAGRTGPHTIAIADILLRWALMWAADMREAAAASAEIDGKSTWQYCIRAAEEEIRRYIANNHLVRAA